MEGTKEADLITAVLMYALRCLAEGDQVALRNMNFGPREIEALRGKVIRSMNAVTIFPASHYVTQKTTQRRAIGTILEPNAYAIVTDRMQNVPDVMPQSWIYPTPAPSNPAQWFIEE